MDTKGKRSNKVFIIAFFLFLTIMISLVAHMASQTTAPWNKPRPVETPADSGTVTEDDEPPLQGQVH